LTGGDYRPGFASEVHEFQHQRCDWLGRPITGTATDPIISLRYSDDGGNLWSSGWKCRLVLQGQYLTQVVWRQLGQMKDPAGCSRSGVTDDAIFRVSILRV
jgi:hypothetical protein